MILTIVGTCVWMGNRTSFAKKWNQHIEQLNAYCLKGRMELRKGQEYQDYDLEHRCTIWLCDNLPNQYLTITDGKFAVKNIN